jgi:hypothetical protein
MAGIEGGKPSILSGREAAFSADGCRKNPGWMDSALT